MPTAAKQRGERVLTQRELNRAVLARQLLLERSSARLPRALERVGGIQAQYAPSMYVGLWTRLRDFQPASLTSALERRTVVQGTLMRVTIHLVSAEDWWPLSVAVRKPRQELWVRAHRGNPDAREMARIARRLRPHLKKGELTRKELGELAGDAARINGSNLWVEMVRVPPSGTWKRRRADVFASAEEWIGPAEVDVDEARDHLVTRYLGAFGPARPAEIADWGGVRPKDIAPSLERLELRSFCDEDGRELLDLPRAPLPDPDTPAPPRFLPVWDASLLVHARRTGILPEEHRSKVFNVRTPQSVNTFLVDGEVAGTWRVEKDRIKVDPFGKLPQRVRGELNEEAERLAAFYRAADAAA
jgi:winged helix DNA-binding protein